MKTVLPLINTSFSPGNALKSLEEFDDLETKDIARGEYYYFTGEAKKCSEIVEIYLASPNTETKLSACMLYAFSNLTLGNTNESYRGLKEINLVLNSELANPSSKENCAFCVFASYLGSVLLHLPIDDLPNLRDYIRDLPTGIRLYATYIMAHVEYLKGNYGQALGMCESALYFCEKPYPISMIYLYCMIAMCNINLKRQKQAQEALMIAWNNAKMDEFLEPFIEHHGLLQGLIESCIKKDNPEIYNKLSNRVIAFSRGWMSIHNPSSKTNVTDALTTMEFSIAMLASRSWSNQEIADHLNISVNTVKHYLSDIYIKLNISKRDDLKNYMLK